MKGGNADDEICIWDMFKVLEAVWKEILALQASYYIKRHHTPKQERRAEKAEANESTSSIKLMHIN